MRQEVARLVHQVDRGLPVGHGDVDVQAEDQQRPRQLLQLLDDAVVADAGGEDLVLPVGERMRAGGRDREPDALGRGGELPADAEDLAAQLADVRADLRADLDDRLVELALDLVAEHRRARGQQLGHVRLAAPRSAGSTIWNSSSTPSVKRNIGGIIYWRRSDPAADA